MGKYLDLLKRPEGELGERDKSDQSDGRSALVNPLADFGRLCRFGRAPPALAKALAALERRCPDRIGVADWQQAIADGRRLLAQWGEQAAALKWTESDLFGLHRVPDNPTPSYQRLARYDETGLVWLLRGRPVVALTAATAAIEHRAGVVTIYRKHQKPAFGPVGDSLDDLE
jgi:hypothetical protein